MQFLFPNFLWACLLIAIPIIIHLFYFKRFKKVYFTNVKYLKEIKEETSNRNRIKNLLILLTRILAILALIFAFAQPFFSKNDTIKRGKNLVSIFIDNSFSMQSLSEDVPLIDKAKANARDIVESYDLADQFQILSHELSGKQQRWMSKEEALSQIDEIDISAEINILSKAYNRQQQLFGSRRDNKISYFLSDFQKSISSFPEDIDSTIETSLLSFQSVKENNVSIDSVWFESPVPVLNQSNKLILKLSNHGNSKAEDLRISLIENGQKKPEGSIDIPANGTSIDTINLLLIKPGWHDIQIAIEDYPIQFDDVYYLSFETKTDAQVLVINESSNDRYLSAAFRGLSNFNAAQKTVNQLQYNQFSKQNLIVLNDIKDISSGLSSELENYVIRGGNLLIFPSKNANIEGVNQFLSNIAANTLINWEEQEMEVFSINTQEFVFKDVFDGNNRNVKLPTTRGKFKMTNFSSRAGEVILKYRDGSPFLSKYKKGKGQVYICAAPLNKDINDLVLNAEVFIPMLYKMSIASAASKDLAYTIGHQNSIELDNIVNQNEIVYKVKGEDEFIPSQQNLGKTTLVDFKDVIKKSGYYSLNLADSLITRLAFNYNRVESNLDFYTAENLSSRYPTFNIIADEELKNLKNTIEQKDKGQFLWKWCLILALIFLGLETLFLRAWKSK